MKPAQIHVPPGVEGPHNGEDRNQGEYMATGQGAFTWKPETLKTLN